MWQIFFILNLSWLYYHYYHYYIYFALKISRNCTIGFAHLCTSDEDFGLCIAFFKFFKCVFFSTILFLLPIYLPSRAAAVFNFPADKKNILSYLIQTLNLSIVFLNQTTRPNIVEWWGAEQMLSEYMMWIRLLEKWGSVLSRSLSVITLIGLQVNMLSVCVVKHEAGECWNTACMLSTSVPWMNKG